MWQEDLFVGISRLSLPVPALSRSPLPGQQHLLVLFQGSVQVAAVEWRVKVRQTSASVPSALALLHKYWAVATYRGAPALCSVCSFSRAVWFLLIIPRKQILPGRIEDGPAFPAPPSRPRDPRLWDGSHPAGSWMLAISLGLPGRGPKGEQETQTLLPMDTDYIAWGKH